MLHRNKHPGGQQQHSFQMSTITARAASQDRLPKLNALNRCENWSQWSTVSSCSSQETVRKRGRKKGSHIRKQLKKTPVFSVLWNTYSSAEVLQWTTQDVKVAKETGCSRAYRLNILASLFLRSKNRSVIWFPCKWIYSLAKQQQCQNSTALPRIPSETEEHSSISDGEDKDEWWNSFVWEKGTSPATMQVSALMRTNSCQCSHGDNQKLSPSSILCTTSNDSVHYGHCRQLPNICAWVHTDYSSALWSETQEAGFQKWEKKIGKITKNKYVNSNVSQ